MFSFYMKKTFVDREPGIDLVNIHYTCTPLGEKPDWDANHEIRAMPRGGVLLRGMGEQTVDDSGQYVQTHAQTIHLPDDGIRRKVISLPNEVLDPRTGSYTDYYSLHHYFEIFRGARREVSSSYTEEIVSKEVDFLDFQGSLGSMCVYWSIYDWDAPQYEPTEDPNFIARYGEDNPYRSFKFYGREDKDDFYRVRTQMVAALPMPRRFVAKIRGPKGARVHQGWHLGNMWQPNPRDRWETYLGYLVHVL